MLYYTQNRFHPTLLCAVCAIRANTNLSYTFQKLHAVYFTSHSKLNPFFDTKHQHLTYKCT